MDLGTYFERHTNQRCVPKGASVVPRLLDYTVHVHSSLILLLNCEEGRPRPLDTFFCQDVAAWHVAFLHHLRLDGAQVVTSFLCK